MYLIKIIPVTCFTLEFVHQPQLTVTSTILTILVTIIVFNVDHNISLCLWFLGNQAFLVCTCLLI